MSFIARHKLSGVYFLEFTDIIGEKIEEIRYNRVAYRWTADEKEATHLPDRELDRFLQMFPRKDNIEIIKINDET
jgi:hypothetical protein